MKFHDFAPTYENSWLYMEKSVFQCPCTQFVWLIVGNWWTILLWSGSTKGWSRAGSAILLICTEVFLWLTYQKLDYPEIFWCNFRNWGRQLPPPCLRAWTKRYLQKTSSSKYWNINFNNYRIVFCSSCWNLTCQIRNAFINETASSLKLNPSP